MVVPLLENTAPSLLLMCSLPDLSLNSAVLPITFPSVARSSHHIEVHLHAMEYAVEFGANFGWCPAVELMLACRTLPPRSRITTTTNTGWDRNKQSNQNTQMTNET